MDSRRSTLYARKRGVQTKHEIDSYGFSFASLRLGAASSDVYGINNETARKILNAIVENPSLGTNEIAKKTNKPERTVQRGIQNLKQSSLIARVGTIRRGY